MKQSVYLPSRNILLWTGWTKMTTTKEETHFEIREFPSNPGIYFENVGQIIHIDTWWKLVIKLDIHALNDRYQQLQGYVEENEKLCYSFPLLEERTRKMCQNIYKLINKGNKRVEELLHRLNRMYKTSTNKRGFINAIGTVAKTLFGTMDAEDEKNINEQLNMIENDQQITQHALDTQLKVLNVTIAHVDNLEKITQENEEMMVNITRRINQRTTVVIEREEVNEHLFIVSAIINDLTRDAEDVMEYVTFAKSGRIHERLIPVEHIIASLKELAPHLTQGVQFPFQTSIENWPNIEKFIKISAYYENARVYTILKFPLISYPAYHIIKTSPLPAHDHGDIFTFTDINQHMLAIDTDGRNYYVTSDNDMSKCIRTGDDNSMHICEQYDPVYNVDAEAPCEVQIYLQRSSYKANCKNRHFSSNSTIWIPLHDNHAWLYSTHKEQRAIIRCSSNIEYQITLNRTGQITLDDNCKLITPEITIKTRKRALESQTHTSLPNFNLTFLRENKDFLEATDILKNVQLKRVIKKPEELKQLSMSLDTLKAELDKNYSIFRSKKFLYPTISITSLLVAAGIIILVIVIIKKYKAKRPKETEVQLPLPDIYIPRPLNTNNATIRVPHRSDQPSTYRPSTFSLETRGTML